MPNENQPSRHLSWDACYNVRDLGDLPTSSGTPIRPRLLIRADNLFRLSPEGQAALRDYGVRTVIDLRLAHELETHPNPFADGHDANGTPRYLNLPLHDPATQAVMQAQDSMQGEYIAILDMNKDLVGGVIKAVAAALEEGGVLVHCHGGKDRTGIIVALLLSLAGVPRETIAEDYALSETQLEPHHAEWLEEQIRTHGPTNRPRWMYSRPETILGALDHLDREYGGVEPYLRSAGVTEAELTQIRRHLTTPPQP
jgi:protein-tyrosine phosphatase